MQSRLFFSRNNRWSVSPTCTANAGRNSYGSSYLVFVMFVTFQPKLKNSDNFSKNAAWYQILQTSVQRSYNYTRTSGRTEERRGSDRHYARMRKRLKKQLHIYTVSINGEVYAQTNNWFQNTNTSTGMLLRGIVQNGTNTNKQLTNQ
jgi:hypothetical protein